MADKSLEQALETQKTAAAQTKAIIQDVREQKAAAGAAPAVATPMDNASAEIAAQVQPIQQAVDFGDMFRKRQEENYAREKREDEAKINRQRLGHDIASLAASIGDMTRASEGAPVSPRDWQRIYDSLNAQEKANIDNYRIRMQKLRDDARQERMAAAQAKAKATADKQQQQYEWLMADIERNFKGDEAEKNRILQYILAQMNNQARVDAAKERSKGSGAKQKYISTMLGNTTFQFPDDKSFRNYILSVVEVLNKQDSYKNAKNGETYSATLLKDQTLSNDPFNYYNKNVVGILRNHWNELKPQAQKDITNSILGHGGVRGNAPQGDGGWSGDEDYDD